MATILSTIPVATPGPWAVISTHEGWGIVNTVTRKTKKIGPSTGRGINYFDRAETEANRRNALVQK